MKDSGHPKLFALCLLTALVQAWIVLKVHASWVLVLLYLGIVGAVPFLMLNGVHGGSDGAAGVIGGILYVLINGAVYYGIVVLLRRWRRKRTRTA